MLRYLTVLQSLFKQAVKLGIIPDTPARAEKLTIPRVQQPKIEIFTKSEAAQMLACLELIRMLQAEKFRTAQRLGTQWQGENWIFTTWNGEIMNPQTPTKQFSKFLERHKLKHREFHSLRHTSATLLLYGGVNIKQVQGRLGHGDIETTNKYLHVLEEADVEAAKTLDIMLLPKPARQEKNIS